jgi:hypothetical protein
MADITVIAIALTNQFPQVGGGSAHVAHLSNWLLDGAAPRHSRTWAIMSG